MKRLQTVEEAAQWLRGRVCGHLTADSRQVSAGDGFVAWPGAAVDARRFVAAALAQGAAACLVEERGSDAFAPEWRGFEDRVACCPDLKAATGLLADAFYRSPSKALDVVAVTGTNGKTSTAWWLAWAMKRLAAGVSDPCALAGTLGMGLPHRLQPTGLTTPDPVRLQRAMRQWVDAGVGACALEASSIGLQEGRLAGVAIRTAVFTNFTQDHLDYHADMDSYWRAKAALFDWPGLQAAVVNVDDPKGRQLCAALQQRAGLDVWGVSMHPEAGARLWAQDVEQGANGLAFAVVERGLDDAAAATARLAAHCVGAYNIQNMLGVLAVLRSMGVALDAAVAACANLPAVPGRMERVEAAAAGAPAPLVLVDYAHTPDALDKALQALRPIALARHGRLWCVFGCGGSRDAAKRPLMGAAAARLADEVIVTSDNPRDEDPAEIARQTVAGMPGDFSNCRTVLARAEAIEQAIAQADAKDVVLLAGKGHEDYQETRGTRQHFSDRQQAMQALAAREQAQHG